MQKNACQVIFQNKRMSCFSQVVTSKFTPPHRYVTSVVRIHKAVSRSLRKEKKSSVSQTNKNIKNTSSINLHILAYACGEFTSSKPNQLMYVYTLARTALRRELTGRKRERERIPGSSIDRPFISVVQAQKQRRRATTKKLGISREHSAWDRM